MKRSLTYLLVVLMTFTCISCGNSQGSKATNSTISVDNAKGGVSTAESVAESVENKITRTFDSVKLVREYDNRELADGFESIKFGKYEQDNDLSNGKEDIEWIVLNRDGSKLLLLSKYILDKVEYNSNMSAFIQYDEAYIRRWLNTTFYNLAFDELEKSAVVRNYYRNYYISFRSMDGLSELPYESSGTSDLVTLMGYLELVDYMGKPGEKAEDQFFNRKLAAKPTTYALNIKDSYNMSLWVEEGKTWYQGCASYWLRSKFNSSVGEFTSLAVTVEKNGKVVYEDDEDSHTGVRPMIFIDTSLISAEKATQMLSFEESKVVETNSSLDKSDTGYSKGKSDGWEKEFFAPVINGGFVEDEKFYSRLPKGKYTFTYGYRDIDKNGIKELLFFLGNNLHKVYKLANDYYSDYELYDKMYYPKEVGSVNNQYYANETCYLYDDDFIIYKVVYTDADGATNYTYEKLYLSEDEIEFYETYDYHGYDGHGQYMPREGEIQDISISEAEKYFVATGNLIVLNEGSITLE